MPCRDQITFTINLICAIIEVSTFEDILCSQKRNGVCCPLLLTVVMYSLLDVECIFGDDL